MKQGTFLTISFLLSFVLTILGAYLKIMHMNGADTLLMIGLFATAVYAILALFEIWNSAVFTHGDKIMWTVAILFLSGIGGIMYFLMGRQRFKRARS